MNNKSSVLLIYTGGTIGMMQDTRSKQLVPLNFSHLYNQLPELKRLNIRIEFTTLGVPIDSSNMNPSVWIELANSIKKNYDKYDGFVILHGSDTMAYTASALSFLLENLSKPVILTGSQLPIGIIRTDGKENLITSIEIAGAKKITEVAIYFEFKLYRGNRTHKFSAEQFQAFQSPNYPVLAEAGVNLVYTNSKLLKKPKKKLVVHQNMNTDIVILKLFPGITSNVVNTILGIKGLKGIILETFGSGNASTEKWFLDSLKKAIQNNIVILNVTQCAVGFVKQGQYETSAVMKKIGVVGGNDITVEAALTKMMFLLGKKNPISQTQKLLSLNLRGEITQ